MALEHSFHELGISSLFDRILVPSELDELEPYFLPIVVRAHCVLV
jgi:hypothetical protein